jgi:hypothetical protein
VYEKPCEVELDQLYEMGCEPYELILSQTGFLLKSFTVTNPAVPHFPVVEPIFVQFDEEDLPGFEDRVVEILSHYKVYFDVSFFFYARENYPDLHYCGVKIPMHMTRSKMKYPKFQDSFELIESKKKEQGGYVLAMKPLIKQCHTLTLCCTQFQDWMEVENLKTVHITTDMETPWMSKHVEHLSIMGSFNSIAHLFKATNSIRTLKVGYIFSRHLGLVSHLERIDAEEQVDDIPQHVTNLWIAGKPVGETKHKATLKDLL